MARPLRIQYRGAIYHVMNRGNSARKIFQSEKNYQAFLDLLGEAIELWEIRIHAFSLMPNHYHLLLETPLGNLARAMRHIDGIYTQRFNRHWKRDGHLFRGRYKSILVEEDAYLVELIRYIHLNPVLGRVVRKPEDHLWSSHRNYLGREDREWLTTDRLLGYFGRRCNLARRKLHQFVMEGVPERLLRQLEGNRWPSVFSSENFQDWVEWNFMRDFKDRDVQYVSEERYSISESQLRKILCSVLEMSWKEICQARGRLARQKRRIAIRCYRQEIKCDYECLSKIFGGIHPASISRAMGMESDESKPYWEELRWEIQNAKRKT